MNMAKTMANASESTPPRARSGPVEISVGMMFLADWLVRSIACLISTLWLKLVLRWLGCPYGSGLTVDGRLAIQVRHRGSITIGNGVVIRSRFRSNLVGMTGPAIFQCIRDGRIRIGDNTGCSSTVFSSRNSIEVGRNVKIGGNVRIYDHDFHALDHPPDRRESLCVERPLVVHEVDEQLGRARVRARHGE